MNAKRWVDNVQNYLKKSNTNDEYILLGDDQLVGVCLAVFIRQDLAPFVKYIFQQNLMIIYICLFFIETSLSIQLKLEWVVNWAIKDV